MLITGLVLQLVIAILLLKIPMIGDALAQLNKVVQVLEKVTTDATSFMFGYLAGAKPPFDSARPDSEFIVAFRVLPLILVISALSSLLYHWRILPWVIERMASFFVRTLRIRGPLGFGAAATFFLGTIEAPLLVRPYLVNMSRSDLFALISCTMATIAGTVMILYAGVVGKVVPNALGHMLIASFISIPAALVVAKALIPDDNLEINREEKPKALPRTTNSAMEAIIKGTLDGLDMVLKITAIIIVLFALVYLTNHILALIPHDRTPLSVETITGFLLQPVMWLIGIPWAEAAAAGTLMGTKIILNEFVAYLQLGMMPVETFSEHSRLILTYALCGFANLGSAGILIGGFTALLPERREEVISLCMRSLLSGNLATLMTAGMIGLIS
jgi:CNT family concentrative nucleoside transporter